MERCEVCGKPIYGRPHLVTIEGAVMKVCEDCAKLGEPYTPPPPPAKGPEGAVMDSARTYAYRPPRRPPQVEEDVVLAPDFSAIVRRAREGMGLAQEELAAKVGEKTSVISKIETGKLRPEVPLARRLEHVLKVKILVRADEAEL